MSELEGPAAGEFPTEHARLPEIVARHAAERPDQVAIRDSRRTVSYAELDTAARRLAARLTLELGVGGDAVAIFLEHGTELIETVLGIAYAGKTYLSLYPEHPDERLSTFIRKAAAVTLVTSEALGARAMEIAPTTARIWTLETLRSRLSGHEAVTPLPERQETPLYILFTSGSTGDSKGLVQTEPNALAHAANYVDAVGIRPGDRCLLTASSAFDAFVLDLYGALIAGATLCMYNVRQSDARGLLRRIVEEEVTTVHFTPSVFRWLLDSTDENLPSTLSRVVLGGEPVRPLDVKTFHERSAGQCELVNLYGLTECSLVALARVPSTAADEIGGVAIGTPVPRVEVDLIDDNGRKSQLSGEVVVRSDIAATPLVPRRDLDGGRLCTGDRARLRADGTLEMLARRDHQVKVRGQRVELGAIENALRLHPGIREAAVVPRPLDDTGPGSDLCLAAFFVPEGEGVSREDILRHLEERLAHYEVPSAFTALPEMPNTISGKIDRQALVSAPIDRSHRPSVRRPPRTAIEQRLTAIWERLFPGETIGIDDDFFALGGHSLLALDLVGRIEREIGRPLQLADIFKLRTLEAIASLLEDEAPEEPLASSCIVPISTSGTKTPLFCIHCGRGRVHHYVEFARELEPERPVYGLQPPGMDGRGALPARVEMFAERYLDEIRMVQPAGPYVLCGYSFGGLVAVEIARRLSERGESVESLYIVDTSLPRRDQPTTSWRTHRDRLASLDWSGRVSYITERALGNVRTLTHSMRMAARRYWSVCRGSARVTCGGAISTEKQGDYFFYRFTKEARAHYAPRPYSGDVVLFRATHADWSNRDRHALGWDAVAGGELKIVDVKGNHTTVMAPGSAREIARSIREHQEHGTRVLAAR